jgi:hypothetical protein
MAATDEFDLFTAFALDTTPELRLMVYHDGTDRRLRFTARADDGSDTSFTAGIVLANGWRTVEIDWQAATAPAANDGLDAGTGGSFLLDVFESRREGYIGLDPVYSDVPAGHIFQNFTLAIYNAGVTTGCGGGDYCIDGSSTRGQMAVFLSKTFSLPVPIF